MQPQGEPYDPARLNVVAAMTIRPGDIVTIGGVVVCLCAAIPGLDLTPLIVGWLVGSVATWLAFYRFWSV